MKKQIVAKFGGTSVKTAAAIRNIAAIVRAAPEIRIVVVSAVGGVTDLLVSLCHAGDAEKIKLISKLREIHLALAQDLKLDLALNITTAINNLENLAVADIGSSAEKIDQILAFGEDLSSIIVQAFLQKNDLESIRFDVRTVMCTNAQFGKAIPDQEKIKERIKLLPGKLCVVQGFIGCADDGRTTTLGRGGSDYSAALLAEALDADELLIYTDVPGVYTIDPNLVPTAHLIEELNFQEMAEMANFGAKILHPATLEPCSRASIPVRILSTFEPSKKGTKIFFHQDVGASSRVRAVTMRKNQLLVTIRSLKMLNAYGFLASIFNILSEHHISVDLITTSEVSVALTIDSTSIGSHGLNPFLHNSALIEKLEQFAEIKIEENLTLVAVIGSGLMVPGMIQKTLSSIQTHRIRLVCYGASSSSIGILVQQEEAASIAKILHKNLIEE